MSKQVTIHPTQFKVRRLSAKEGNNRGITFGIDKRQKFVIGTIVLSLGLFFTEFQFGKSGLYAALVLSLATNGFLFWAIYEDFRENKAYSVFVLPFLYSLAFG